MANIHWLSRLSIFDETTPFTPPANAAAWASEASFEHIRDSVDVSALKPAVVEDMRSQTNPFARELNVEGLRTGELGYSVYAAGVGSTTTAGSQVSETVFSRLYENAWCGITRTNSTTLSGTHSTTSITVVADTNFAEGACIGWESPTTGEVHIRRLVQNTAGTTWSLDEALPETPVDSDVIHGAITIYPDPDILADSNSSGRQLSYHIAMGDPGISTAETWVLIGCVNTIGAINMNRGELPTIDITAMSASATYPHESPPAAVSWSADPVGVAPVVIGPKTRVLFNDVGTTTNANWCLSNFAFNPGLPRVRVETTSEPADNAMGTCHYAFGRADSELSFVLTGFGTDEMDDWAAGTMKHFRLQGGTAAGFCFAVGMPNGEVRELPNRATQNDSSARAVALRGHKADPTASGFTTTTDLTEAPFYIVQL